MGLGSRLKKAVKKAVKPVQKIGDKVIPAPVLAVAQKAQATAQAAGAFAAPVSDLASKPAQIIAKPVEKVADKITRSPPIVNAQRLVQKAIDAGRAGAGDVAQSSGALTIKLRDQVVDKVRDQGSPEKIWQGVKNNVGTSMKIAESIPIVGPVIAAASAPITDKVQDYAEEKYDAAKAEAKAGESKTTGAYASPVFAFGDQPTGGYDGGMASPSASATPSAMAPGTGTSRLMIVGAVASLVALAVVLWKVKK